METPWYGIDWKLMPVSIFRRHNVFMTTTISTPSYQVMVIPRGGAHELLQRLGMISAEDDEHEQSATFSANTSKVHLFRRVVIVKQSAYGSGFVDDDDSHVLLLLKALTDGPQDLEALSPGREVDEWSRARGLLDTNTATDHRPSSKPSPASSFSLLLSSFLLRPLLLKARGGSVERLVRLSSIYPASGSSQ